MARPQEIVLTPPSRDRTAELLKPTAKVNGIDFVELGATVPSVPFVLRVHFLNKVPLTPTPTASMITIGGGDRIPSVNVIGTPTVSVDTEDRPLLVLQVQNPQDLLNTEEPPGDFSNYTLTIAGIQSLDPRFSSVVFSFRALCPSDFDCAPVPATCPADDSPLPPIDYTAKDFQSFRQALLAFSALRYPGWQERSEADFGLMFAEVLSAVGDELSYLQDRVAAEATLETATQRRSLVSLARLVDYEPAPAISGTTTIMCRVAQGTSSVPAGVRISAVGPDGSPVPFEIGTGLNGLSTFPASFAWNFPLLAYWWDDGEECLPRGSTEMWVQAQGLGLKGFDPTTGTLGTALLIQTDLPGQSIREIVHVTEAIEEIDPLFADVFGNLPAKLTHIKWAATEALQHDHDLPNTLVGGNLLPATQGQRVTDVFAIPADVVQGEPSPPQGVPLAIARWGPNSNVQQPVWVFRWPLQQQPLAWLNGDPTVGPQPEILLTQKLPSVQPWTFELRMLDAGIGEQAFTLDPVAWRATGLAPDGSPLAFDIDGDQGTTIRFGDGVFGVEPPHGSLFQVTYRVGLGATGNVAADTITLVDPSWASLVTAASNPFPVTDASDAETPVHIQRSAPQAFRAQQFRAVRPEDYEAAAESLPWVLKAGTSFRWTGSWLTVFTAADPKGATLVGPQDEIDLIQLLDRRRLVGYESYSPPPVHVSIDLEITVCIRPEWLPGDVERLVLDRLGTSIETSDRTDFFFSDHFAFGTPLFRSRLEAAIQSVPGVRGVLSILYRRRGTSAAFLDLPEVLGVGSNEILRVDNDPSFPERGTIRVIAEGGR
jgi:hypothetical protein